MHALVDTHCHLDFNWFDSDREAVLERSWTSGIERILNPGIDLDSSAAAITLGEMHPQIFCAVGVHPNDALTWEPKTAGELRRMASHPKVAAIGEIGLDYYRDHAPRDLQQKIFTEQLRLAEDLRLPVVIHNRDASDDMLAILSEWVANRTQSRSASEGPYGVLHSFSGDLETAQKVIELGFMIGFTGPLTFQKADALRQIAADVPLKAILVETDSPFLTPHPYRGRRNEPAHVRYIVEKLAEIRGMTVGAVAEVTCANAQNIFKW